MSNENLQAVETADTVVEETVLTTEETTSDVVADESGSIEDADTTPTGDDEGGAGEGDTPEPGEYAEFAMPEGMELDAKLLESAAPLFKELGLNQEQAQKLVDFQAAQVKASAQEQVSAFEQLKSDWLTQSQSDKEIGGDNFDKNIGAAKAALDAYGSPELRTLMDDYGIGNNPEIIRFMVRVGNTLKEDVPGMGNPSSPEKSRVEQLYPSST